MNTFDNNTNYTDKVKTIHSFFLSLATVFFNNLLSIFISFVTEIKL